MSVLGRARRVATELRDRLDLDAVRDLVRDAAATGGTERGPTAASGVGAPTDEDRRVVGVARALGAPNPYALLAEAAAAEAVGTAVGPARLTYGDDTIGVVRAAGSTSGDAGAVSVSAFHATDVDAAPLDADAHWHGYLAPAVEADAVAVDGVGRAALRTDGGLYVLGGSHVLYLTLRRPDGTTGDAQLAALARSVLARLEE